MSALDRRLLEVAGLSASGAAEILKRSRQAVTKGIRGDTTYFGEGDLRLISEKVGSKSAVLRARFLDAVEEEFGDLANRLRSATSTSNLLEAIVGAKRIWLILPDFVQGRIGQQQAYQAVFDAAKSRFGFCEVIAFCDRLEGRTAIEGMFETQWFEKRKLAITQCDLVAVLPPMVVVNPHENPSCYVLSHTGFVDLAPHEAAGRVSAFAAAVSNRLRQPPPADSKPETIRPFNLLVAAADEVQDANAQSEGTDFDLFSPRRDLAGV